MAARAGRGGRRPRSQPRPPGRWLTAGIIAAGFAAGVGIYLLAYQALQPGVRGLRAALACWTTVPYVIAGAVAWRRRPESRLGPLMIVAGFVPLASFLSWSNSDLLYTLAMALEFAPPVMFMWVYLAYPTGIITSRLGTVALGLAGTAAALSPVYLVLGYEEDRNLLATTEAPRVVFALQGLQLLGLSVALIIGALSLVRQRLREGRPLRPWLGYLIDSFVLVLLMLAFLYLVPVTGWTVGAEPVRLATFALLGLAPVVFLIGLLTERLGRDSVTTLMHELEASPAPAELELAVARALRDPSAEIVYWVPEFETYVRRDGKEASADPVPGRASTPIVRDGRPVGLISHDIGLNDEPQLLSSVAMAIGMAIENARLQAELRARLEELRGSRIRILEAEETERRRLERDLHDGAQQRLIALSLALGELGERVAGNPELEQRVAAMRREVSESLSELRDIAHGIHPAAIIDHGLGVAIESLATRSPLPVEVAGSPPPDVSRQAKVTAYYLVSESLANVAKHSRATSVVITLGGDGTNLVIEVADDGVGGAETKAGFGLRGLADRVEALGGNLRVWSPIGGGTRVRAEIPCAP
jgi:signal transduction histidine kinase